jgi:hypothetical protein
MLEGINSFFLPYLNQEARRYSRIKALALDLRPLRETQKILKEKGVSSNSTIITKNLQTITSLSYVSYTIILENATCLLPEYDRSVRNH